MKDFEHAVRYIMAYLSDNHYCDTIVNTNKRCFRKLEAYLKQEGTDYTPEKATEWLHACIAQIAATDKNHFQVALLRLQDVYECGAIRPEHDTRHLVSYTILSNGLKDSLDLFLHHLGETMSAATVENYKHSCARFLIYMQKAGISRIRDITYPLLCSFYKEDTHNGKRGKATVNAHVSGMMAFFFERGDVPYGFSVIFHYLFYKKECCWENISAEAHEKIKAAMSDSPTVTPHRLHEYGVASLRLHAENGYSKTAMSTNHRTVDLLAIFLEMYGYGYNPGIADIWFAEVRRYFKTEWRSCRRALCMAADYYHTAEICLETVYRENPRAFDLLPGWCREPAGRYVAAKEKEGWAKSTLDMIRSSICRLCGYLDRIGIRDFHDVEVSHIKEFNIQDKHKTPYGKNAYNTRVRKFLIFLGENGYLDNPMLSIALTHTSAPREAVVVILTKEEMEELQRQLDCEDSRLSLRKKAMLLLGLKMGMRSSDIVKLGIDDINWDNASIRFVQEKTAVEVNLPMPTEVGNALFRYITEERHSRAVKNIFLSEKAPHRPVKRSVCSRALETALPDRDVKGPGFHVTRKTYATNLLRNGVGAGMVAEALGQRGTSSVHRYLSLDARRMRMCPLSLADNGIGGWTNGR